ncbi:hypothetical protein FJY70_04665 [candidate division WOR-3 bacterium]|nr:hypothetical protein [candidate division WOR-3 bacterium]
MVNRGNDPEFLGKSARIPTLLEEYGEGYRSTPTHLVRLRHFDTECWSLAFYTCRDERSEPCAYPHDSWFGTVEQAFDVGPFYLAG